MGDKTSEQTDVCAGVLQGAILGTLLFNVIVNNLPSALTRSKVMMYADDTTVYCSDLAEQHKGTRSTYGGVTSFNIMDLQKWLENELKENTVCAYPGRAWRREL